MPAIANKKWKRRAKKLAKRGVEIMDPRTAFIDGDAEIGEGTAIYPSVVIEGRCVIGKNAVIGPFAHLKNAIIGDNCAVRQSAVFDSAIEDGATVGPFAHIRDGAEIGPGCRIGNFVEIKKSGLAGGVKAAHLAYIGDADVGANVNYGCGAITCNYDGKKKHRTAIGEGAFIGSNANLVAPVAIGKNAFVAAGSTITDDVQDGALAIARCRQTEKEGYSPKE